MKSAPGSTSVVSGKEILQDTFVTREPPCSCGRSQTGWIRVLHDEWRKTLEGQHVMLRLLLTGFQRRAYADRDYVKGNQFGDFLLRTVYASLK